MQLGPSADTPSSRTEGEDQPASGPQALIARGSMADRFKLYTGEEIKMYTVEIDSRGCSGCGKEVGYTVVGPDGVEECAVYNDRGAAEEIADLMNLAYEQGRRSAA